MTDDALSIELGDQIVDQFTTITRPAPAPTIDREQAEPPSRPRNRRPRRHRTFAILGLAALAIVGAGCQIPPEYVSIINDGASTHASEHVFAGQPEEPVMCSISGGGWLVPSYVVVRFGGCDLVWPHAAGTTCTREVCTILGIAEPSTVPLLQATVDTPGRMGS